MFLSFQQICFCSVHMSSIHTVFARHLIEKYKGYQLALYIEHYLNWFVGKAKYFDHKIEMYISQRLPYNYGSITHISFSEYSVSNLPTILPNAYNTSLQLLGSSTEPNYLDYLDINILYCGGKTTLFMEKILLV